jgi:hypothetical protein
VVSFVQAYSSRIFNMPSSALEFWGMYQQKPAWYFNKKTQEFIENKDSENRENLPKDYYSDVQSSLFWKFNR